ncbi:protein kinase domain-containing protein [Nonomuraea sp. CA-141351]|uniref:serine/threonine-protein kinase n=1 Tax=Nonomuraea sp. CA-141351 TaxID=3239996 RepID=UPI003D919045
MSASRYEGRLLAGRYRLLTELGRGGMGRVWQAHDELLERPVAVKEVTLDQRPRPEREALLGRTMREARLAARLSHPNIAAVYDVVVADERPWIVLQLVPAPTLADVVADQGPLPPGAVARIGLQVLEALQAAHAAGIVHRDVKPANILLDADGRHAVLTDFGLAASLRKDAELTQTGMVVGTPAYIAPERARGGPSTPQTDLWSLGVTLYTAVEGRTPFEQVTPEATISAVLTTDPAPFQRAGSLAPLIAGLLRKDPDRRTGIEEARRRLRRISVQHPEQLPQTGAVALPPATTASALPPPVPTPAASPTRPAPSESDGRPALAASARRPPHDPGFAGQAARRRLAGYARHAVAVTALVIGVLAAWSAEQSDQPSADPRPQAGTPTAPSTPSASSAPVDNLQNRPVAISSTPAARHRDQRPAGGGTGTGVVPLPPGQAKKAAKTWPGKHGHRSLSPGKGHGKGHK